MRKQLVQMELSFFDGLGDKIRQLRSFFMTDKQCVEQLMERLKMRIMWGAVQYWLLILYHQRIGNSCFLCACRDLTWRKCGKEGWCGAVWWWWKCAVVVEAHGFLTCGGGWAKKLIFRQTLMQKVWHGQRWHLNYSFHLQGQETHGLRGRMRV